MDGADGMQGQFTTARAGGIAVCGLSCRSSGLHGGWLRWPGFGAASPPIPASPRARCASWWACRDWHAWVGEGDRIGSGYALHLWLVREAGLRDPARKM